MNHVRTYRLYDNTKPVIEELLPSGYWSPVAWVPASDYDALAAELAEVKGDRDAAERAHDFAHAACVDYEARVQALEAETARLNMEMAAYRQGCTRADAEAMMAVKAALEAEKEARKERRHSTDSRCPNMAHKRYAMLNCTECSAQGKET